MTDSHAHLDALEEPDAAVARASAAGVATVITIGTGIDSCQRALELADRHPRVHAALGIDPHQAGTDEAQRVDELRDLLAHGEAVAVGETGLDGFHRHATPAAQRELFERQIALAAELGKPLVVHCRETARETAAALASFDGTVILHCFSEPELLEPALEHGWFCSFAGNVTYPRSHELRAAAARVPLDRILAETDSPYLSPQGLRGQPNEPANVVRTVAALAEARGEDAAELALRIDENAAGAFRL